MKDYTSRYKIISFLQDIDVIGIRVIANNLPKLLIPKPHKNVVTNTLHGFLMEVDPVQDKGVDKSIYYTGTYEKGTLSIIKNVLKKGDVFVDVGANIGLMSIFASLIVKDTGKVYAFEPNPKTLEIFKKNIELNKISNVAISNYAVGSTSGEAKIYERSESNKGCDTLVKPDFETVSHNISVTTLADYFDVNEQQKISLIKLDVEGYELEALKGAKSILYHTSPMLIIECSEERKNSLDFNRDTLYNFVKGINKYYIFKLSGSKKRESKLVEITKPSEMPKHDNIFCFTEEHLKQIPEKIFKALRPKD